MKKIDKIKGLIFSLSLFCIFNSSLAAPVSSISHFKLNNAAPYDVAVVKSSHSANMTVSFSAPPPNHRVMRGTNENFSIKTLDVTSPKSNGDIQFIVSNRPEWVTVQ